MSEKLAQLVRDKNAALKAQDRTTKDILTLIINEANNVAKNAKPPREVQDDDVMLALNRTVKKARETKEVLASRNVESPASDQEIEVAQRYLPSQMDEALLRATIAAALFAAPSDKSAKGMVMKVLNENHKGTFDSRLAATIIDEMMVAPL